MYLIQFENALRTVEGCEDVTLPYWDITSTPPDFLFAPPFDSYTLPRNIHSNYPSGYTTSRYDAQTIVSGVAADDIPVTIERAMRQPVWSDFVTFTGLGIEAAHDSGHGACGPTLANPDAAAFDPLFWFFHANWDRLWWEWQQIMHATTLWTFRSTITGSTAFLEPPFNTLDSFDLTSNQTIDLSAMDVGYASPSTFDPAAAFPVAVEHAGFGSLTAARGLRVLPAPFVSVRLKGIDRLAIPGSFRAILKADGEPIARRTFFQSTEPRDCDNCREKARINLDFLVEAAKVTGSELTVEIEILTPDPDVGPRFPLHACGNPTLNVRILLHERQ